MKASRGYRNIQRGTISAAAGRFILAALALLLLLARPAAADTYTWDVSGGTAAPQDGSGIWSTSTSYANWWNGSTDVSWPTGGTDTAAFGGVSGTAGTLTVDNSGVGVGAMILNTPDGSTYTITGGPIALGGAAPTITVNTNASIGSVLTGGGTAGLVVNGGGSLELTAANTYSGPTTVSGAILRLSNSAALPSGSNLTVDGGVVELNAGDFLGSLGTGPGQVQFTSNGGGFSAVGANRVVNFSNSATLTWGGSGSFLQDQTPLMLGTQSADSMVDFQNPIQILAGSGPQMVEVTAGSGTAAVNARLSGVLSGSGGLTITGGGNLELTASNTYTGPTTVSGTILRLSNSAALPSGSNLTLDGGVVELNAGDFLGSLGTGPGQVQFTSNGGGFSAVGANRVVNFSNSATLTWGGSGSFLQDQAPLMLGTSSADSMVDFQNPIQILASSGPQTVQVTAGSGTAAVDGRLSGTLSGGGGLTVSPYSTGTLELTASNTYTGPTTVSGGVLRLSNSGALPGGTTAASTGSNLVLDGGVVELNAGDFTRSLGSGSGQVQFTAFGGGFSAVGANRIVNLGGNSATLTWGSSSSLPDQAPLLLGTRAADSILDFQNPINLLDMGNGPQTVQVTAGSGTATVDARISGVISGSGGLTITGDGTLELTASNFYTGPTIVSGYSTLRLSNSAALPGGIAAASTGSNLAFDGGVVELNAGDFTRSVGTGQGQVQFSTTNGGGFSAVGGNRIVNLGGNSATLTWGASSSSFLPDQAPLLLGTHGADSTVDFQNPINLLDLGNGPQTVQVTAGSGTATVDARLSGTLSGSGGLMVAGNGCLELTASNMYTGPTTVSGFSVLRLSNSAALPGGTATTSTGSNLTLDGGVVELNAGDFTRSLGTGPGQVQFTSNGGGFSAVGGNRIVNIGGNSATLTWGSSSSLPDQAPLLLGTRAADSTLDFQNPINLLDLGNGPHTVWVTAGAGTAAVNAKMSGVISGSGGLTVTGAGALELTASNTYTGPTIITGYTILRLSNSAALPGGTGATTTGSNLTLDSGMIELNAGDFTRSLGTGPGQVQFTADGGGFAAIGANRIVNLGGNSATLTWGSSSSLPDQAPLLLGTWAADSTLDFQNPINLLDLGNGPQTVQVTAGSGTATEDAQLSGAISGSGGLAITGDGTLLLSGTDNTYSGGTVVESGTLIVNNCGALPDGSSLTVGAGGTFIFDPSVAAAPAVPSANTQHIAAVPEPGTLALLAAALALRIGVAWRRRIAPWK